MRLSKLQNEALQNAINDVAGEVYLFGSRVDDTKKGGDVDILVFSTEPAYKLAQQIRIEYFKKCEEKIDVVVMNPNNLNEEQIAFLNVIEKIKIK